MLSQKRISLWLFTVPIMTWKCHSWMYSLECVIYHVRSQHNPVCIPKVCFDRWPIDKILLMKFNVSIHFRFGFVHDLVHQIWSQHNIMHCSPIRKLLSAFFILKKKLEKSQRKLWQFLNNISGWVYEFVWEIFGQDRADWMQTPCSSWVQCISYLLQSL